MKTHFNTRTSTDPDTFYSVCFEDKIISNVYHTWDNEEFPSLSQAQTHLAEIISDEENKGYDLSIFKLTVEKIAV